MKEKEDMRCMFLRDHPALKNKGTEVMLTPNIPLPPNWVCVPSYKSRCVFYAYYYLDASSVDLDIKLSVETLEDISIKGAKLFRKELERLEINFIYKDK